MQPAQDLRPLPSPTRQWRDALRALASESVALARQSLDMTGGLKPDLPRVPPCGQLVVVMHGLFATAGAMRVLRGRIEHGTGLATASFSYPPWWGVAELAAHLRDFLAPVPSSTRVHLVGHSLGGLAARYYVQVRPRDSRVIQTISLGSPFAGTRAVSWMPGRFYDGLRPGSRVLRAIERSWRRGTHVPHFSIAASHDLLVQPATSAVCPPGDKTVIRACGHASLLYDRRVAQCVVDRIRSAAAAAPSSGAQSAA